MSLRNIIRGARSKEGLTEANSTYVTMVNLTADELRASHPTKIDAVWTTFVSPAGEKYTAVHLFTHLEFGPYIILETEGNNAADFKAIKQIIIAETQGQPEERTDVNVGGGIYDIINLPQIPTAQELANFVDKCAGHFNGATIPYLHLHSDGDDPRKVAQIAGFPREKISRK
jgi:hypothetical protein